MTRKAILLLFLVSVGALLACQVSFTHSVSDADPSVRDPLIGLWSLEEIAGKPPSQILGFEVESGDQASIRVTLHSQEGRSSLDVSVARVADSIVLAVPRKAGLWSLLSVKPLGSDRLSVSLLTPSIFEEDIRQGAIAGTIEHFDSDTPIITIQATAAELRTYLERRVDAFGPGVAVLRKEIVAP